MIGTVSRRWPRSSPATRASLGGSGLSRTLNGDEQADRAFSQYISRRVRHGLRFARSGAGRRASFVCAAHPDSWRDTAISRGGGVGHTTRPTRLGSALGLRDPCGEARAGARLRVAGSDRSRTRTILRRVQNTVRAVRDSYGSAARELAGVRCLRPANVRA